MIQTLLVPILVSGLFHQSSFAAGSEKNDNGSSELDVVSISEPSGASGLSLYRPTTADSEPQLSIISHAMGHLDLFLPAPPPNPETKSMREGWATLFDAISRETYKQDLLSRADDFEEKYGFSVREMLILLEVGFRFEFSPYPYEVRTGLFAWSILYKQYQNTNPDNFPINSLEFNRSFIAYAKTILQRFEFGTDDTFFDFAYSTDVGKEFDRTDIERRIVHHIAQVPYLTVDEFFELLHNTGKDWVPALVNYERSLGVHKSLNEYLEIRGIEIGSDRRPVAYNITAVDINMTSHSSMSENGIRADATKSLPFADGSLDVVFSRHFLDPDVIKEVHRLLKPGGRAFFLVDAVWSSGEDISSTNPRLVSEAKKYALQVQYLPEGSLPLPNGKRVYGLAMSRPSCASLLSTQ